MLIVDRQFGWVVVVVSQPPPHEDRFYGPFETETKAREWIKQQPFHATSTAGLMPLRRTDIQRDYADFYSPNNEMLIEDFWLEEE